MSDRVQSRWVFIPISTFTQEQNQHVNTDIQAEENKKRKIEYSGGA